MGGKRLGVPQRKQLFFRQLSGFKSPMAQNPLRKSPQLGRGKGLPLRITQMAGQQQKTVIFHQRNLRLGAGGALTSSLVSLPSSDRIIG